MSTPAIKRTRAAAGLSPAARDAMIQSLPGENCPHCNQPCTAENKAVQCDLCGVWAHVKCEGLPEDIYDTLNHVCEVVNNISYYCDANHCCSRIKQLTHHHYNTLEQESTPSTLDTVEESLSDLKTQIEEKIQDLSSKIEHLLSNQSGISMEVDVATQSLQTPPASASIAFNTTASSIADELADRERRKNNLIIYNLPEKSDREDDKKLFVELCKTVYSEEFAVNKILRMGRRIENKHRPLLVVFKHETDKSFLLTNSARLRKHDVYKTVYFSPDRTKFERLKHKKLVEELKQRKAKGETNLMIRNNAIVNRRTNTSSVATPNNQPVMPTTNPIEKQPQN